MGLVWNWHQHDSGCEDCVIIVHGSYVCIWAPHIKIDLLSHSALEERLDKIRLNLQWLKHPIYWNSDKNWLQDSWSWRHFYFSTHSEKKNWVLEFFFFFLVCQFVLGATIFAIKPLNATEQSVMTKKKHMEISQFSSKCFWEWDNDVTRDMYVSCGMKMKKETL